MRLVPSLSALSISSSSSGSSAKSTPKHIRIQQGYTTRSESETTGGAYVRVSEPEEHEEVVRTLARGLARDPGMNWWGGVKEMVPVTEDGGERRKLPTKARRIVRNIEVYQRALLRALLLSGGFATVAVVPTRNPSTGEEDNEEVISAEIEEGETIIGAALWLPPGKTLDFPIFTILRSGLCKVMFTWGFTGIKRALVDFSSAVEDSLDMSFKAHGQARRDSWHLVEIAINPEYEGKGLCGLLMKDGFKRTFPKPIHLEVSTTKNRELCEHFGFEVDEEHRFGEGVVDENGIATKGETATGYPVWVMTKWKYWSRANPAPVPATANAS